MTELNLYRFFHQQAEVYCVFLEVTIDKAFEYFLEYKNASGYRVAWDGAYSVVHTADRPAPYHDEFRFDLVF